MEQSKIDRINELSKKSKLQGLTEAEKEEQKLLREEYISGFRNGLRQILDSAVIKRPDGRTEKLKKK